MIKVEFEKSEAAAIMQLLLEEQKEYSFEHAPKRIDEIRSAINKLDDALTEHLLEDKEDVLMPVGEVNA